MHCRSAPLQALIGANSHLATRAREGFCVRGRARVGRLMEPAKRRARPSPLAASRPRGREVDAQAGNLPENGQMEEDAMRGALGRASGHTSAGLDRDRVLWSGAALARINLDVQPLPTC